MNVLALDQSTHIGWAVGRPNMGKPVWGTKHLKNRKDQEGEMLADMYDWLSMMIKGQDISHVFIEQTFLARSSGFNSRFKLFAIAGVALLCCHHQQVRCQQVLIADWHKRFLGTSKAPPSFKNSASKWFKEKAVRVCASRGWMVDNDNEADALGILDYGLCTLDRSYLSRTDPMFRRSEDRAMSSV